MIGSTLSHYRITAALGAGGMGEVYRATDTRLGREVALKLLPEAFVADAERFARFEREARLLASLNHPNVAQLYAFEAATLEDGSTARLIAMELCEGEDLAVRLQRGAVPLDEAIGIAKQIAVALEEAHEKGIVHRDLKPANVKLTPDGKVKVLDFGLAKAWTGDGPAGASSADLSHSPTLAHTGTAAGVILGTAAYMSPEQARGRAVDRRADVWAFGVVLYEMLTGARAFRGDSIADTMASVLKLEPDFDKLPASTPAGVRRVLRRCLQKDKDRRLHDIADARIELEEADLDAAVVVAEPAGSGRVRWLPPLAAAGLGLLAFALLWSFLGRDRAPAFAPGPDPVRRSWIPIPVGRPLNVGNSVALSPDGSALVLAAGLDERSRLYLRRFDSFDVEEIPGTEGAISPFFSPDGEHVAFFAAGELKRVSLRGGGRDVTTLCDLPVFRSGTWDTSGWIYFNFSESRLARVRQEGGDPEEIRDIGDVHHVRALPDGRGILLTLRGADSPSQRTDTSRIAVLSPVDGTLKTVFDGGYNARYLPSGHLAFLRAGGLFAVPFDLDRLEASPPALSVQPDVRTDSVWGEARYDTSSDGTLVYVSGGDYARVVPTWIDLRTGEEEALPVPSGVYSAFDLSPDATQLAIQNLGGAQDQVYVYDFRRETFTRLTLDGSNRCPVWSHDGREVLFGSTRDGEPRLFRQPADGSAPASRLLTNEQEALIGPHLRCPGSVTRDGQSLLLYTFGHPVRAGDLWKVPLDASGDPEAMLATEANEIIPQVSPDGKWLAYLLDRTGPSRIVVRPFPGVERREWVVSGTDAYDPRWSPRGDALLYREGWGRLMAVPVGKGAEFTPGVARQLIETDFHDSVGSSFAVSPDGTRVLVNKPVGVSLRDETPLTLVTGWAGEVSRLVPRATGR